MHCGATGLLPNASRAGVALRASVAMRPPQRSNGLPEDAHRCATSHWSNASRVQDRRCSPARLVLCRARRARVALRASVANTSLSLRNHHARWGVCMRRRQLQPRCSRWSPRAAPSSCLARLVSARARRGRLARRMAGPILGHNALRWGRRAAPIQCPALVSAHGANHIPRATGQRSSARGKTRRVASSAFSASDVRGVIGALRQAGCRRACSKRASARGRPCGAAASQMRAYSDAKVRRVQAGTHGDAPRACQ